MRGAHRLREQLPHLALVAAIGLFDIGEQQINALAGLHAGCSLGLFASQCKILGVKRRARHRK